MLRNDEVQIKMRTIRPVIAQWTCQIDQFLNGAAHIHERLLLIEHKSVVI